MTKTCQATLEPVMRIKSIGEIKVIVIQRTFFFLLLFNALLRLINSYIKSAYCLFKSYSIYPFTVHHSSSQFRV